MSDFPMTPKFFLPLIKKSIRFGLSSVRNQQGGAVVELAMTFPIFIVMFLLIADLGYGYLYQSVVMRATFSLSGYMEKDNLYGAALMDQAAAKAQLMTELKNVTGESNLGVGDNFNVSLYDAACTNCDGTYTYTSGSTEILHVSFNRPTLVPIPSLLGNPATPFALNGAPLQFNTFVALVVK